MLGHAGRVKAQVEKEPLMRFDQGWVPLPRSIFKDDQHSNPFHGDCMLSSIWLALLSWANVEPTQATGHGRIIELPRGDVLTSYEEVARVLGITTKQARLRIEKLVTHGFLGRKKGSKGLHLTIQNYEEICYPTKNKGSTKGSRRAADGQQMGNVLNKETKKQNSKGAALALNAPTPAKNANDLLAQREAMMQARRISTANPKG